MLGALAAVGSLLGAIGSSILAPVLGYFQSKDKVDLEAFRTASGVDLDAYKAYLAADLQMATLRASQNMWWGARLIVLAIAGSVAVHFAAVCFDSIPAFGHAVGSWHIAALPAPLDSWEGDIVLSFFLITPAAPLFSALTARLHR